MKTILLALMVVAGAMFAATAHATPTGPTLTVTPVGLNPSNNRLWQVEVAPDPELFGPTGVGFGGSMAVELAFAIDHTDLLNIDVNTVAWDFANPGHNPFTGTITEGLWLDLIGDRAFGAFGSVVFLTDDPVRLFTIETAGGGLTTVRYGVAAFGDPVRGARIAQGGMNFDGYTGFVTIPEPASLGLVGWGVAMMLSTFRGRRTA